LIKTTLYFVIYTLKIFNFVSLIQIVVIRILFCCVMKAIIYFFIAIFFLSAETANADEKETELSNDFNFLVGEYLETEDYYENLENQTINTVIIYDTEGNVTRQIQLNEDIALSTPAILKPLISTSDFLTRINGVSYYICHKNRL